MLNLSYALLCPQCPLKHNKRYKLICCFLPQYRVMVNIEGLYSHDDEEVRVMDAQRIRIIHAADLHLESSFASLGVGSETGNRLREAQRTVLRRILDVARQWPADAVCIAGDLFDSIYVGEAVLREVMEILEHAAPLPVYITPGNRDPYVQDSPYALTLWPENVTVFPPGAWHAVPHEELPLTVHGFGYDGANDPQTPFGKLQISRDGRIHVAVAHGTEQGHKPPAGEVFAPFKITDVARDELAYLAMGHFHDITEVRGIPHGCLLSGHTARPHI